MDTDQRFATLYQGHYAAVLRYACRRTDLDSARDVAAETFLVAWRRLADVPADPARVQPWLYGVARRVLANSDRSRRRSEHLTARLAHDVGAGAAPDPADAVVNPRTGSVYVANDVSNTVSVISGRTGTVTATVRVGRSPQGIAFDAATGNVYVANMNDNTVSVLGP